MARGFRSLILLAGFWGFKIKVYMPGFRVSFSGYGRQGFSSGFVSGVGGNVLLVWGFGSSSWLWGLE